MYCCFVTLDWGPGPMKGWATWVRKDWDSGKRKKRAKGSWWSLGEVLKEVRVRTCLQGSLVRELGRAEAGKPARRRASVAPRNIIFEAFFMAVAFLQLAVHVEEVHHFELQKQQQLFQRLIAVMLPELSFNPDDAIYCSLFLGHCRLTLDCSLERTTATVAHLSSLDSRPMLT